MPAAGRRLGLGARQGGHAAITLVLVSAHTGDGFYQREEIATAIEMAREGAHRVIPIWLDNPPSGRCPTDSG